MWDVQYSTGGSNDFPWQLRQYQSLSQEDLEKEMATHSSILAWEIPWTEGPGRLQSMGSQEPDTTEQLRFFPDVQPRLEPFKGYVAV